VTQFQTALPTVLTQQLEDRSLGGAVKVFAQDEPGLAYCLSFVVGLRPAGYNPWPP
jgi:hypothetical protein